MIVQVLHIFDTISLQRIDINILNEDHLGNLCKKHAYFPAARWQVVCNGVFNNLQ